MDTGASVAMASDAACTESMVARSQSDTESVASPTAVLERDLIGVETKLRGLAGRRARVEAELVRITCEGDVPAQATVPSTARYLRH